MSWFLLITTPTFSFDNKLEKEVKIEKIAIKLVCEVQRGHYDVITTDELKKWPEEGKDMVIVDTMPLEASHKKVHVPGAKQFLFPIPDMNSWDIKETAGKVQATQSEWGTSPPLPAYSRPVQDGCFSTTICCKGCLLPRFNEITTQVQTWQWRYCRAYAASSSFPPYRW